MTALCHLGFVGQSHGTTNESPVMVDIPCKNFVAIGIAVLNL